MVGPRRIGRSAARKQWLQIERQMTWRRMVTKNRTDQQQPHSKQQQQMCR
jgi:hypothetical protein